VVFSGWAAGLAGRVEGVIVDALPFPVSAMRVEGGYEFMAGAGEKLTGAITTGVSGALEAGVSDASGEDATKADLAAELAKLETRLTHRFYAGLLRDSYRHVRYVHVNGLTPGCGRRSRLPRPKRHESSVHLSLLKCHQSPVLPAS